MKICRRDEVGFEDLGGDLEKRLIPDYCQKEGADGYPITNIGHDGEEAGCPIGVVGEYEEREGSAIFYSWWSHFFSRRLTFCPSSVPDNSWIITDCSCDYP